MELTNNYVSQMFVKKKKKHAMHNTNPDYKRIFNVSVIRMERMEKQRLYG